MKEDNNYTSMKIFQVADLFRQYGYTYLKANNLSLKQYKVFNAITNCRTSTYGYHIDKCDQCSHIEHQFNSCRDRHCPLCQNISRRKWIDNRLKDILPVSYYHAVFTLPKLFFPLILFNRRLIYELLFSCASSTLLKFGRDPKWLGGELGFFGILHSWGQNLWQHPHVHFIVPGGALADDDRWITPRYKQKFLFPVHALSQVFCGKFIEGIKKAYYNQSLVIPDGQSNLKDPVAFEEWIDMAVSKRWVVYCKSPCSNPEKVIGYIGAYTHRVAISNSRILDVNDGQVNFKYKDYRKSRVVWDQMHLSIPEFIKRFLWHVLPDRFHKVRHFGFMANGRCKTMIAHIMSLIDAEICDNHKQCSNKILCPVCRKGWMSTQVVINRYRQVLGSFADLFENGYAYDST
jgi:hypothetical protein